MQQLLMDYNVVTALAEAEARQRDLMAEFRGFEEPTPLRTHVARLISALRGLAPHEDATEATSPLPAVTPANNAVCLTC